MKKQKKFLAVLSAAAVSTMIAAAVSTTAFAKTTDVIAKIDGQEVKINFEELTTAYENKAAGLDSELFNKYNEREGLTALLDDKNGFVDYKAVQEAAEDAVALGEKFVLNDFTETTEKTLADFKPEAEWKDDKVVPVTPVEEDLKVESVSAINTPEGDKLEVVLSDVPEEKPTATSVTVTRTINGEEDASFVWGGGVSSWNEETKTLTISEITPVEATEEVQEVVYSVAYGDTDAVAANALTVEAVEKGLAVESVSAINAKEIKVVFNKAVDADTIIDDKSTVDKLDDVVKANTIYVDGTAVTWKANLSKDGKTLTMQPDGDASGVVTSGTSYKIEINQQKTGANFVKDLEGNKAAAYLGTIKVVDETRATLDKVEKINPDTVRAYFSEPVQHPTGLGTDVTMKYNDGTVVSSGTNNISIEAAPVGAAVNYVDINISKLTAGKDVTVIFTGIKDYANNVSKPISITVKKDVDEVKPVVKSVVPTSLTTFEIKASKAIKTVDVAKIKVNGTLLTAGTDADSLTTGQGVAEIDSKDNTKIVVTLGDVQSGAVPVEIEAEALEDFASTSNKNDVYKTILNFNLDKTAPQVISTKVIKEGTDNFLIVNFDEEIVLEGTSDLTFKYVDKMGVTQEKTVPVANVSVDATDKALKIKLEDNSSPAKALPTNFEYTVEIPGGYVKDNFGNSFVKKEMVFTLGTASSKLELISATPIAEKTSTPGVIEVKFAKAVDVASATNTANYVVEDAQVEKVKLTANGDLGATVEVYLKDNTVKISGNYNVTIKGVKGYKENVTEMDAVTKNIALTENVRPTVKEVSIDKFDADIPATTITVTFSEAVKNADNNDNDFSLFIDGKEVTGANVSFAAETTGSKTLVVTIGKDLSADVTAGKSIKLVAKDTLDIKDEVGNILSEADIVIK